MGEDRQSTLTYARNLNIFISLVEPLAERLIVGTSRPFCPSFSSSIVMMSKKLLKIFDFAEEYIN